MKLFARDLLNELTDKATTSPRQRASYNIHSSSSDPVQRFFVVAHRETYFRPHRHHTKSELGLIVRGSFDVVTFDESGTVTARYAVGENSPNMGFETPRATWHTLVSHADGSAFLEIKEGPYDPATAVEFAAWGPPEGHAAVPKFLAWVRSAQPGDKPPSLAQDPRGKQ
jgi:cupin fold WbuC family metalloprotein